MRCSFAVELMMISFFMRTRFPPQPRNGCAEPFPREPDRKGAHRQRQHARRQRIRLQPASGSVHANGTPTRESRAGCRSKTDGNDNGDDENEYEHRFCRLLCAGRIGRRQRPCLSRRRGDRRQNSHSGSRTNEPGCTPLPVQELLNRQNKNEVKLPCVTQNDLPTVASFRTWRG